MRCQTITADARRQVIQRRSNAGRRQYRLAAAATARRRSRLGRIRPVPDRWCPVRRPGCRRCPANSCCSSRRHRPRPIVVAAISSGTSSSPCSMARIDPRPPGSPGNSDWADHGRPGTPPPSSSVGEPSTSSPGPSPPAPRSSAIVIAVDGTAVGIGAGDQAGRRSNGPCGGPTTEHGRRRRQRSALSLPRGIDTLAAAGVAAVIEPGRSVRDQEVIAAAEEHGMALVFTGSRHFLH